MTLDGPGMDPNELQWAWVGPRLTQVGPGLTPVGPRLNPGSTQVGPRLDLNWTWDGPGMDLGWTACVVRGAALKRANRANLDSTWNQ